jgi:drug/metabolite transporter (DMT)-like permease
VSRRAWVLFVTAAILGGMPYLLIKVAIDDFSPLTIVWLRCAIATVALLPFALRRTVFAQIRAHWWMVVLLAFTQITVPFTLIAMGEQYITSSLAALLIALEPLVLALLVMRFYKVERLTGRLLSGLIVGITGVLILLGFDVGTDRLALLGAAMVLLATFGYAAGILIVKRGLSEVSPLGLSTATLGINAVLLAPIGATGLLTHTPTGKSVVSVVVLGVACTAVAFVAYYALIPAAGASRAAVTTYLNPAVAVVLGVLFLGEPITGTTITGFVFVITGSWLSTGPFAPPKVDALPTGHVVNLRSG